MNNERFVEFIYQLVLQRDPDNAGLVHWSKALAEGLTPIEFFERIISSEEFSVSAHANKYFKNMYLSKSTSISGIIRNNGISSQTSGTISSDRMDSLNFIDLKDDWKKFEDILCWQQQEARNSPSLDANLKLLYLNEDRDEAFNRFRNSYEFRYTCHLLAGH